MIIEQFEILGRLYVPINLIDGKNAIDFLKSNEFLIVQDEKISFPHQSILDYFLAEKMLKDYFKGNKITDTIGNFEQQTPMKRYQIQMCMQNLLDIESKDFISAGIDLLKSESVRFYNKYVFLELLNQIENVDEIVRTFILEFCEDPVWGKHIMNTVVQGKPQYYGILRDAGIIDKWMSIPDKDL
jgi:hypothetical protein